MKHLEKLKNLKQDYKFNKKHNPLSWLNYVIKEGIIHHVKENPEVHNYLGGILKIIPTFIRHKDSRFVQKEIKKGQDRGNLLVCDGEELKRMMQKAGFSVPDTPQLLYRDYDNRILGYKNLEKIILHK